MKWPTGCTYAENTLHMQEIPKQYSELLNTEPQTWQRSTASDIGSEVGSGLSQTVVRCRLAHPTLPTKVSDRVCKTKEGMSKVLGRSDFFGIPKQNDKRIWDIPQNIEDPVIQISPPSNTAFNLFSVLPVEYFQERRNDMK